MKNFDSFDNKKIKSAFVWLMNEGGQRDLVERFLYDLKMLIADAIDENYKPERKEWNTRLRYAAEKVILLNNVYKESCGEPFIRFIRTSDRQSMSDAIAAIATAVVW